MTRSELKHEILGLVSLKIDLSEAIVLVDYLIEDLFGRKLEFDSEEVNILWEKVLELNEGVPLAYVSGIAHFFGNKFSIGRGVLIPRPETEELVDWIIKDKQVLKGDRILDIGTGSGCIAHSLAIELLDSTIFGLDISEFSRKYFLENRELLHTKAQFILSDFLDEANWSSLEYFDIVVSNPPYIDGKETSLMSDGVLKYEPHIALFPPGEDSIIFYKKISDFCSQFLNKNGAFYVEINEFKAQEIADFLSKYWDIEIRLDMQGKPRMLKGKRM